MGDLVEEVKLKDSIVSQQQGLLFLGLHVSKVRVRFQAEAFVALKSSEGNISFDFVSLSHAEGSLRNDLAVVLDSQDSVEKSVLLDQTAVDLSFVGVLGRGVLEGIALFLSVLLLCVFLCIQVGFIFFFDVDVGAVSKERSKDLVVLFPVLSVHVAEFAEGEVSRAGKVERLGWELVLFRVGQTHSDVVVAAETAHATPEH